MWKGKGAFSKLTALCGCWLTCYTLFLCMWGKGGPYCEFEVKVVGKCKLYTHTHTHTDGQSVCLSFSFSPC